MAKNIVNSLKLHLQELKFNREPRTMERRISMCLFLLVVWCSTGGVRMVVSAEPTVTAWIVTPEADRKEGGRVEMRCVATNLETDHIVEWRNESNTLRWGGATLVGIDRRFMFETMQTNNGQTTQNFTITDLQRGDTDEYICNVNYPMASGGSQIVVTTRVYLSVLYLPNEHFPICSPDGPITVDIGTQINMRCSSEYGDSALMMHVSEHPTQLDINMYKWMISINNGYLFASLDLTVDVDDHSVMFQCIINSHYFPDMNRSCTIGPIRVTEAISPTVQPPTTSTVGPNVMSTTSVSMEATTSESTSVNQPVTQSSTDSKLTSNVVSGPSLMHSTLTTIIDTKTHMQSTLSSGQTKTKTGPPTAIIAGASAGGLTVVILLVILITICLRRGMCNPQPKPPASHTQQTSDPPDDTIFTTDQTVHSQPNIYQDSHQQTQDDPPITGVNIYYDPNEISLTASPLPELSWHSSTSPVTRGTQGSAAPLYAHPHRESTTSSGHDAREGNSHQSTKQTYSNPVFDSQESDPTPGPSQDPLRPTVMVPPMQGAPIKPKPFKPKPQRVSSSQDGTLNQQDHQRSSEAHGTPPSPQQVHLDAEDGNQPSSSTNTGPVYASVMKNRAK